MSGIQPEMVEIITSEQRRAVDDVLIAASYCFEWLKGGPPLTASLEEAFRHYGLPEPVNPRRASLDLWSLLNRIDRMKRVFTGTGLAAVPSRVPDEPDEAPGLSVEVAEPEAGADQQQRLSMVEHL
jgi:hypothetical protein